MKVKYKWPFPQHEENKQHTTAYKCVLGHGDFVSICPRRNTGPSRWGLAKNLTGVRFYEHKEHSNVTSDYKHVLQGYSNKPATEIKSIEIINRNEPRQKHK